MRTAALLLSLRMLRHPLIHVFDSTFPSKHFKPRAKTITRTRPKPTAKSNNNVWYTPMLAKIKVLVIALHDRYKTSSNKDRDFFYSSYLKAKEFTGAKWILPRNSQTRRGLAKHQTLVKRLGTLWTNPTRLLQCWNVPQALMSSTPFS